MDALHPPSARCLPPPPTAAAAHRPPPLQWRCATRSLTKLCVLRPLLAGTQLDDEGDFVHRPAHWNGVELDTAPKKLSELSTKAQHHHGAVQPFIAGSMESQSGYDTYRVYLLFDDDVGMSMYAGAPPTPCCTSLDSRPPSLSPVDA